MCTKWGIIDFKGDMVCYPQEVYPPGTYERYGLTECPAECIQWEYRTYCLKECKTGEIRYCITNINHSCCIWGDMLPWPGVAKSAFINENEVIIPKISYENDLSNSAIVNNDKFHEQINIFPNPTNGELKIITEELDHYKVEVLTMNGQKLFSDEFYYTIYNFDIAFMKTGIYIITIKSISMVKTEKIIKF